MTMLWNVQKLETFEMNKISHNWKCTKVYVLWKTTSRTCIKLSSPFLHHRREKTLLCSCALRRCQTTNKKHVFHKHVLGTVFEKNVFCFHSCHTRSKTKRDTSLSHWLGKLDAQYRRDFSIDNAMTFDVIVI